VNVPLCVINCHKLASRTISDELCGVVCEILGDRIRKSSRGVVYAIEYISNSITCFLSLNAGPDDGGNVGVFNPRLYNERADAVHDDYGIVVLRGDSKDEVITIVLGGEIIAS